MAKKIQSVTSRLKKIEKENKRLKEALERERTQKRPEDFDREAERWWKRGEMGG